ncbi:VapC toxin family PIN domain ribonuclease [Achromobacter pulmonis]|uniref:VapC toxin family PIN domain ribonuclease n=1 Tax=Achromobacter pulmonis TaxID=1389932 RepID=A0A2N8K8L0_9BURK|nr:type II toxin-antitoxin system VapC family toxin [Achromobacter pulmonis]MBO9333151.1 PIN domain-containing protein [Achromobacter xylosoxidans]PND29793.1 VapC toxin family PIN domain ribonuclease [Achromobacter pulmonis]
MKVTVDANVLVRGLVRDDPEQASVADQVLREATLIAVPLPCLCELFWILRRVYGFEPATIAVAIRALIDTENVVMNRPAVEAGLALLEAGGDFADGVIAYEGMWLGGETFVSFDKRAVSLLKKQGEATQLLS